MAYGCQGWLETGAVGSYEKMDLCVRLVLVLSLCPSPTLANISMRKSGSRRGKKELFAVLSKDRPFILKQTPKSL